MLLKTGAAYGVKIGHRTVFTRQGVIDRYKLFLGHCYDGLSVAKASVLYDIQNDMVQAGFTWEEVEGIEAEFLKSLPTPKQVLG